MTAGHRDPGVLALACMLVHADPDHPSILGVARYLKYSDAAIKQLRRYVAFVKSTKEEERAGLVNTAALLEEKAADLIEETTTVIAESANDIDRPLPSDLGRLVNVYMFPDLSGPCDELLTTGFCATTGCPHEHDWCSFFEVLSYITAAKGTLDICIYVLSCQYVADALVFAAASNPNLKIRILADREMASRQISMTHFIRSQCLPNISIRISAGRLMHNKFIVVDETTVIAGSANLSVNAVLSNDETTFVLIGHKVGDFFTIKFDLLWDRGHMVPCPFSNEVPQRKTWSYGRVSRSRKRQTTSASEQASKRPITEDARAELYLLWRSLS